MRDRYTVLVEIDGAGIVRPLVSIECADGPPAQGAGEPAAGTGSAATVEVAPAQAPSAAEHADLLRRADRAARERAGEGVWEVRVVSGPAGTDAVVLGHPRPAAVLLAALALGRAPGSRLDLGPSPSARSPLVALRVSEPGAVEVFAVGTSAGEALRRTLELAEAGGRASGGDIGAGAEDPAWAPTLAYLAPGLLAPRLLEPPGRSLAGLGREDLVGEVYVGSDGLVCATRANAERAARPIVLRRFLAPGRFRLPRTAALLRRGVDVEEIREATGMATWLLEELASIAGADPGEGGGTSIRRSPANRLS
jgi:hypothetical protein